MRDDEGVRRAARQLAADLRRAGRRVHLDDRTDTGFGRRTVDWELKGVPVRASRSGPRDLAEGMVTMVTRHTRLTKRAGGPRREWAPRSPPCSPESADDLRTEAGAFRLARTGRRCRRDRGDSRRPVTGFARVPWSALGEEGERALAAEAVSVRCLQRPDGSLAEDDEPDARWWRWSAAAY